MLPVPWDTGSTSASRSDSAVAAFAQGPACTHEQGTRRAGWDQWRKPNATEQERAWDSAHRWTHRQSAWNGRGA